MLHTHTHTHTHLRKDPESHVHNSDLLNLIPCQLDLITTPFSDATILTYEIELPTSVKKVGFNLMDDEYFTIPYITDKNTEFASQSSTSITG